VVGLAAGILTVVSVGASLYHWWQLRSIAARHLHLVATGPSELLCGIPAEFVVTTATVTGKPIKAQIESHLYSPEGKLLWGQSVSADANEGPLAVVIPDLDLHQFASVKLNIVATHEAHREEATIPLPVRKCAHFAQLATDRPCYGPGSIVRYRVAVVPRVGQLSRAFPVRFELLAPTGAAIAGSQQEGLAQGGVAGGEFALSGDAPEGRYALVAKCLDGGFPDSRCMFLVRPQPPSRFQEEIEFLKPSYAPGDTVVANLRVRRRGEGAKGSPTLNIAAKIDGQTIVPRIGAAEAAGTLRVEFALPAKLQRGEGVLAIDAEDAGVRETMTRPIPIRTGKIGVEFFPEGGILAHGLESRVYLTTCDPLGRPVAIQGSIVDGHDREIAKVATTSEGRGSFVLLPQSGETYRLKVGSPGTVVENPELPSVSAEQKIAVSMDTAVVEAGAPMDFKLRTAKAGIPLIATAWRRGVMVAHKLLVAVKQDAAGAPQVSLPLDDTVAGILRLIVYDYSARSPKPVAERLVYRRAAARLTVRAEHPERYAPGARVKMSFLVCNEKGEPLPAALSVAVVGQPAGAEPTKGLDDPGGVEDALSNGKDAAVALDLMLGARRGASFQLAKDRGKSPALAALEPAPLLRQAAVDIPASAPAMFDNLGDLRAKYEESLSEYRAKHTRAINALITLSFLGGLALALLVTMLAILRILAGVRLWVPIVVAASCCFVAGAVLMDRSRLESVNGVAVSFASFHLEPQVPAPEGKPTVPEKPFVLREYAHQRSAATATDRADSGQTLYWHPCLVAGPDGRANISFDLPDAPGAFRVEVDACHEGRTGAARITLHSLAPVKPEAKPTAAFRPPPHPGR
jgi:hypothetical protein